MIVRLWRARLQPGRDDQYERFAAGTSLPMFREQVGVLGALPLRSPDERAVLSCWQDRDAVALLASPGYRATVRRLEASGMLLGPQRVELFEIGGGFVDRADVAVAPSRADTDRGGTE